MPRLSWRSPFILTGIALLGLTLLPDTAAAQLFPDLPCDLTQSRYDVLSGEHLRLTGNVQLECETFSLSAEQVDIHIESPGEEADETTGEAAEGASGEPPGEASEDAPAATDEDRSSGARADDPDEAEQDGDDAEDEEPGEVMATVIATGDVVYSSAEVYISAERVEYSTADQSAVFVDANGAIDLGDEVEPSMFGGQEPEMLFYGEMIERIGPRTYRITKGAFTTCVQPTPRWQLVSTTFDLNLDRYAFLRNAVLRVKGVPLFYFPALYYPMQEDGRATGFLMPTFGASTYHGQSISNAFFWAINRSQDATFYHDWFRQRGGQGTGGEYRYAGGGGSEGNFEIYRLVEPEREIAYQGGVDTEPARKSYQITGQMSQELGEAWTLRSQIDYFSDITVQQTYNYNVFDASNSSRTVSGNLTGQLGDYAISGTYDFAETFFGARESALVGGGPRVTVGQGKTEIPGTPLYYSFDTEYVRLLRVSRYRVNDEPTTDDFGLNRFDVSPVLQWPFTRWPFLTIDSTLQWRTTYWDESLENDEQVPVGIGRSFFEAATRATGPTFVKIWDTPDSSYSERMKHVIEPWYGVRRVSAIESFDRIVRLEGIDSIVGNVWQYEYGLDTRLYARVFEGSTESTAREILSASVSQSYYTDENASQYDRSFRTSFSETPPSNFSPLSFILRSEPTPAIGVTFRAEFDPDFHRRAYVPVLRAGAVRTVSAEGTFGIGDWLETRGGWSQRRFVEGLPGFNDPEQLDHYLNSYTAVRNRDNTIGGLYSFNYDVHNRRHLTQRLLVYYRAQCCSVSFEYMVYNFEGLGGRVAVPADRRFNVSFTLAGLGTFANVLGAFAGSGYQ